MKRNVIKKKFRLVSIVVSLLLLLSIFGIVTASATEPEGDETVDNFYPYGIRPYLEQFSYDVGDEIPINVVVDADCNISSFSTAYNGFSEEDTLTIVNDTVKGSMICDGTVEAPQFSITVVLENGKQLQASIYGFVCDETVYINVNSLFGAKDIYWSEMLASGARTEEEYKSYMAEVSPSISPSISPEYISIEGSASTTALVGSVRVFGVLQWKDDWGNLHPLRYTKLRVSCPLTLAYILNPNLGVTYTDANGYFSTDANVFMNTNITLDVYPEGKNTVVKTGAGAAYLYSEDISVFLTSSLDVSTTFDMSTELGRAFQISQAVIAAAEFAETVNGEDMAPVTVSYPHIQNWNNCYYDADGDDYHSGPTINILGNQNNDIVHNGVKFHAYASWDVIMHEYFHHVQHQYSITDSPGGWHSSSYNMYDHYLMDHSTDTELGCKKDGIITCANPPASLAKEYAIKIAYSEAVATVLGGIAQEYLINSGLLDTNIATVGNDIYQSYNGALINYGIGAERKGEANEATLSAILWDIYDNDTSEEYDILALGYQEFWDVLVRDNGKTLTDFVNSYNRIYGIYLISPLDKLASILSEYDIASSTSYQLGITLNRTPEFAWEHSYSLGENHRNNVYVLNICRPNRITVVSKTLSSKFCSLTEEEWNSVLSTPEDYFYWSVSAYHDDGNGCVTGPYTSKYVKVMKPTCTNLTVDDFPTKTITSGNNYFWFKFVAPTSGTYSFYSISSIDTFGELFEYPQYGSGINGRYAYDDNSGSAFNFSFTRVLEYNEVVYIRVTGVEGATGDFAMYTDFFEHLHIYTATIKPNDQFTHRCNCDCGLYEDVNHDWENLGGTTIRCIICKYRYSEQIPGGEIQGGGDGTAELQGVDAILPSETWSDEEE